MDPVKIAGVQDWLRPNTKNVTEVQSFMGFVNFYHRLIPDVTSRALGYPTRRLGLVAPESRGVWTGASACALRQPSVTVQVFRVVYGCMHFK